MQLAIDECIKAHNQALSEEERPMTQSLLARAVGVSQSTISRWQSGQRAVSLWSALKLAEVLSCSVRDLLHLPDECQYGMSDPAVGGETAQTRTSTARRGSSC